MTLVRGRAGKNFRYSIMMPSKGLLNNPGENNCFMNSSVQVLWHLDVFRRSLRLLDGHACLEDCCIFCALQEIFKKFQASDKDALPPDVLRIAMAKAFQGQHKFQLGRMDDAAECFENILRRLHFHIAYKEPEDMCSVKHCIPHQKFAMQILEQTSCKCGATSEPLNFFQLVSYVSASALIKICVSSQNESPQHTSFGKVLKYLVSSGERRPCPDDDKCLYVKRDTPPTRVHRTLLNSPDIVGIGIIWDTDRPSSDYIITLLDCLGKTLEIKHIFDNVSDQRARKKKLGLVGIMTYYGKHYTTFFYNTRQKSWFYFDDARVNEIGDDWDLVKSKCKRGKFQPLLVLYANPDGEPIEAGKASKKVRIIKQQDVLEADSDVRFQSNDQDMEPGRKEEEEEEEEEEGNELSGEILSIEQPSKAKAVKRKSFKKIVGSAFKKRKSVKSSATILINARNYRNYPSSHGDQILFINGHTLKDANTDDSASQPANEKQDEIKENNLADRNSDCSHVPGRSTKQLVQGETSVAQDDGSLPKLDKYMKHNYSSHNKNVSQSDRLYQHQQHLRNLSGSLGYNDRKPVQATRTSPFNSMENATKPDLFNENDHKDVETKAADLGTHSSNTRINQTRSERQQVKDHFEVVMNAADSLLVSSRAAEDEGNLVEAFHLCTEANKRYRDAIKVAGMDHHMKQYADKKRWNAHDQSRVLSTKIDEKRSRRSVSNRALSKTSDYGSYSDTSCCSPVTPLAIDNRSPTCIKNALYESSSKKPIRELSDKCLDYPQDRPSMSEIEQLSALLNDFDVNDVVALEQTQAKNESISNNTQQLVYDLQQNKHRETKATNPAPISSHVGSDSQMNLSSHHICKDPNASKSKAELRFVVTKILDNIEKIKSDSSSDSRSITQDTQSITSRPKTVSCSQIKSTTGYANHSSKTDNLLLRQRSQFNDADEDKINLQGQYVVGSKKHEVESSNSHLENRNVLLNRNKLILIEKDDTTPNSFKSRKFVYSACLMASKDTSKKCTNDDDLRKHVEKRNSASPRPFETRDLSIDSEDYEQEISAGWGLKGRMTESERHKMERKVQVFDEQALLKRQYCYNDKKDYCTVSNDNVIANGKMSDASNELIQGNFPITVTDAAAETDFPPQPSSTAVEYTKHNRKAHVDHPLISSAIRRNRDWTIAHNVGNDALQLCEQCGSISVEKPKKYCGGCQSEYL